MKYRLSMRCFALIVAGLASPLAGCSAPDYVRQCVREHGRIRIDDYLEEQGLDECPGTPEQYCRGRILSREAATCAAEAYILRESAGYQLDRLEGLAFGQVGEPDEEGLVWLYWMDIGGTTTSWAMRADSGELVPYYGYSGEVF